MIARRRHPRIDERRAFTLATCAYQLHELRTVCRRTELAKYIAPAQAVRLINPLQALALVAPEPLPMVNVAADPFDNCLPGCAEATAAQYLVLSDKTDVLALRRHSHTRIVTLGTLHARLDVRKHWFKKVRHSAFG